MDADHALAGFVLTEPAPAKINLALHVTGRRADGYHLLDSLVTFTRFGDRIGLAPAGKDAFSLSGAFAPALSAASADGDNLVLQARDRLRAALIAQGRAAPPVHIHLEKNMPVASGIGGGSADAAAALRALARLWDAGGIDLSAIGLGLGADVPMCLASTPLVARGIGEALTPLAALPAFSLVLANPLVGVATPAIFKALERTDNAPLALPASPTRDTDWIAVLSAARNDLEPPARVLCPAIGAVAEALGASGTRLVRMSGSGATCFALYEGDEKAEKAARALAARHGGWFFQATKSFGGRDHVTDR